MCTYLFEQWVGTCCLNSTHEGYFLIENLFDFSVYFADEFDLRGFLSQYNFRILYLPFPLHSPVHKQHFALFREQKKTEVLEQVTVERVSLALCTDKPLPITNAGQYYNAQKRSVVRMIAFRQTNSCKKSTTRATTTSKAEKVGLLMNAAPNKCDTIIFWIN